MPAADLVAIVQARMGATRLPGKVLADIGGLPMLVRVVERIRRSSVSRIVVATSTEAADDAVAACCAEHKIACFRGSETDVLDRFYRAAQQERAAAVVRITADCPMTDPAVIDRVIASFEAGRCDYATNTLRYTYPDGLDTEVFTFAALEDAWHNATLPAEREHVTPYIRVHGVVRGVEHEPDLSTRALRWTVDDERDLAFVRAVYARLGDGFGMDDVLALLEREPDLISLNAGTVANEGYYRSIAREPVMDRNERSLERSDALKARAEKLIPSCSQTFSKAPTQFVQGVAPVFLERGEGCRVFDVDGNVYIDYAMALGPVLLGYGDPAVHEAVERQLRDGVVFTLPHPLEVEIAELLVEVIPSAEMVRFGKNGSDATSGAVRVARAYTGRDVIAACGYHGWQDWYIGTTDRNAGVPEAVRDLTVPFTYNDLASLEAVFAAHPGGVAAVIMEPVGVVPPEAGFLESVRDLTHRHGALLIFDEVITGFRLALGGAQDHFGVLPDLTACGKAMANGFPLSAVVGRADVMELFDEIFFSFTYGGEALSLAAAGATIRQIRDRGVIAHIWEQGRRLQDGFNILAQELGAAGFASCVGLPPRTVAAFSDAPGADALLIKSLFQQECLTRGVLFTGSHNVSAAHSPADIDQTLRVYRAAFAGVIDALASGDPAAHLHGQPVQPVFRKA